MTGDAATPQSAPDQGSQLASRLCQCGCGRQATKASGYVWYWHCDPNVSEEEKRRALQLGGRRGAMTAAEVTRLLEGADLATTDGRNALRDRFLRLRLAGRIGTGVYRDLLAAVDGAGKDRAASPKGKPARPIVVEVPHFGPNGDAA